MAPLMVQMDRLRIAHRGAQGAAACLCAVLAAGCQPDWYRQEADKAAADIIAAKQKEALGKTEAFRVEPPSETFRRRLLAAQGLPISGPASLGSQALKPIPHWPEKARAVPPATAPVGEPNMPNGTVELTLVDALQVAARNNRDYQTAKEGVFRTALALDLEAVQFRNIFAGAIDSIYTTNLSGQRVVGGLENSGSLSWQRQLKSGAAFTAGIALDLVKLATLDRESAFGILTDATVTVPLLRGSGRHIVTEPLTQAERDVVYSLQSLERLKRQLAVQAASEYLAVLQQLDQLKNAEDNYRRLKVNVRRARRLADAGRLPETQVDQALQDELRARDRWVGAQQTYGRRLDAYKLTLGLPTDGRIELDRSELQRLAEVTSRTIGVAAATTAPAGTQPTQSMPPPPVQSTQPSQPAAAVASTAPAHGGAADEPVVIEPPSPKGGGPLELPAGKAIAIALRNRLDLRTANGRVYDAQRKIVVAADALQAGLTLTGTATAGERRSLGSADAGSVRYRPERGVYAGGVALDLPLERTAERNLYRESYLALEQAVRNAQELEDRVKLDIQDALRGLLQARESYRIQAQAVRLAERRVASTKMFLEAGQVQIRDVLEAEEALVSAQNALTAALVNYRVAELELQRDMDVLVIDEKGLWSEYKGDEDE